jgi:hypothetical protein
MVLFIEGTVEGDTARRTTTLVIYSYISAYIQALYMNCPGLLKYIR